MHPVDDIEAQAEHVGWVGRPLEVNAIDVSVDVLPHESQQVKEPDVSRRCGEPPGRGRHARRGELIEGEIADVDVSVDEDKVNSARGPPQA
jgi:hypothetical protein